MQHTTYVVLAQDLNSDQCEWEICRGVNALAEAEVRAKKFHTRKGRWTVSIRECSPEWVRMYTATTVR